MTAAATPTGATGNPVSHPRRSSGRQNCTESASSHCAEREAKHLAAVARTLQWADECAERGDHLDAIAWLETLEAIGDKLPDFYEIRRHSWSAQLARTRTIDETAGHLSQAA